MGRRGRGRGSSFSRSHGVGKRRGGGNLEGKTRFSIAHAHLPSPSHPSRACTGRGKEKNGGWRKPVSFLSLSLTPPPSIHVFPVPSLFPPHPTFPPTPPRPPPRVGWAVVRLLQVAPFPRCLAEKARYDDGGGERRDGAGERREEEDGHGKKRRKYEKRGRGEELPPSPRFSEMCESDDKCCFSLLFLFSPSRPSPTLTHTGVFFPLNPFPLPFLGIYIVHRGIVLLRASFFPSCV